MKVRKIALTLISILLLLFVGYNQSHASGTPKLIVFYSPSCHECTKVKNELMPDIEREFKDKIEIEYRDITDIENYKFLLSLKEKNRADIKIVLPVLYFKGHFLNGKGQIENRLRNLIIESLGKSHKEEALPQIDLIARFQAFGPLVILGAGLIDGINPCAFTVIVFFISFLALQGYRKRELTVIGLVFIFAVFLTYFILGIGVFSFLYRLKGFWFVSRAFNFLMGIFSIILGALAIYDFFKLKKTGQTEGLLLQLPKAIKNQIHSVIGLHYRNRESGQAKALERGVLRLAFSALATGFLVSILEAVCTGQAYLPTISFVLKISSLRLHALGYLLLYNLMFIVPLLIIFLFALLGATSQVFSKFLKQRLAGIKLLMAVLFFALGIFLIWRA